MMAKEEEEEIVEVEVKVGDSLAFQDTQNAWTLATVTKVTPSGRIVCTNGQVLNPNLTVRGIDTWSKWYRGCIPTEKILRIIRKQHLIRELMDKLRGYKWGRLSEEQLINIYNIIKEQEDD